MFVGWTQLRCSRKDNLCLGMGNVQSRSCLPTPLTELAVVAHRESAERGNRQDGSYRTNWQAVPGEM